MVNKISLVPDISGERIDSYLTRKYPEYSRSYFQRLIKEDKVLVNNKSCLPSYKVKLQDKIEIELITFDSSVIAQDIKLNIIYEDNDIIIVNKMPGVVVHPACGHPHGTLLNALLGYAKGKFNPMLVHRLDKDTSGVMIVAKNERAKNSLVKQFQHHKVKKVYLAVVAGEVKEGKGRIEAPLGRSPQDRKKIVVGPLAKKMAVTEFSLVKRNKEFSLVEAYPITGRTHQIRSHFAYIGHPVVGDNVYGNIENINGKLFNRQMLHAYKISFSHPTLNKRVEYVASLPKDIKKLWNNGE